VYWLPALVWAGVIFGLSSMSEPPKPGPVAELPGWTLLAHGSEYFILGVLLFRAGGAIEGWRPSSAYLFAAFAATLYGATDELHQVFVPERQMDALDWLVDCLGASVGALVMLPWRYKRNKT
jgi:VanZ family protein